jgi:hypothetical protein
MQEDNKVLNPFTQKEIPPTKRANIKELDDLGLFQEVNRQFLHPLGLSLDVIKEDSGKMLIGGITDLRDSPDGVFFPEVFFSSEKEKNISNLKKKTTATRNRDCAAAPDGVQSLSKDFTEFFEKLENMIDQTFWKEKEFKDRFYTILEKALENHKSNSNKE